MRFIVMLLSPQLRVLSLIKLPWPKKKSIYDIGTIINSRLSSELPFGYQAKSNVPCQQVHTAAGFE